MDFSSLLDSATSSLKEIYTGPSGWQIAGIVIGVLGALGIFAYFTFFAKGAEKKSFGEWCKGLFTMKGNFALDLAKIILYYMSIKLVITSFEPVAAGSAHAFYHFVVDVIGGLVWYRFVYEIITAVVKFCKGDK
jgi:hypothetical protein